TNNYQHRRPSHFNLTMMSMCQYVNVSVCQYVTNKRRGLFTNNSVKQEKGTFARGYTYYQDKISKDFIYQGI
ncbi:MAG: hypothetical protein ACEY3K_09645, partial [Wolbachia sp.]